MTRLQMRCTLEGEEDAQERVHSLSPRTLLISGVVLIVAALAATFELLAGGLLLNGSAPAAPAPAALASPTPLRVVAQLGANTVAVDVRFDAALGLPTQVGVGDHVDVLAFLSSQVTGSAARTVTVLKDATILHSTHESAAQTLTFALLPEQALVVEQLGQIKAPLFLVLRAPGSLATPASDTFTDHDLDARVALEAP